MKDRKVYLLTDMQHQAILTGDPIAAEKCRIALNRDVRCGTCRWLQEWWPRDFRGETPPDVGGCEMTWVKTDGSDQHPETTAMNSHIGAMLTVRLDHACSMWEPRT